MRRQYPAVIGLTGLALVAVAVAASAQVTTGRARVGVVTPSGERSFVFTGDPRDVLWQGRRGRLGVVVGLAPDSARDSVGARITGVTPGGPADRAGVRIDDIVMRLNGTRLVTGGAARDEHVSGEMSAPGMRLVEMASRLDAGDTVRLDVRRGDRSLTLTFVAGESETDILLGRFGDQFSLTAPRALREGVRGLIDRLPRTGVPGEMTIHVGGPFADLELVRINPGLAEYFGTSEGLLVVDAPSDSALNLRAGDVILSIGNRRPTSPAHALRILSTYEAGETVSFEIFRSRRRTTVTGRMPNERRGNWSIYRNSLEAPAEILEHLHGVQEMLTLPHSELLPALPKIRLPGARIVAPVRETGRVILWT